MRSTCLSIGIAVLVAMSSGAGIADAAGGEALTGQFPFIVVVTSPSGSCTGTLVRDDWVLAPAHCGDAGTPNLVYVGERSWEQYGPTALTDLVPVAQWIPHPDYDGTPGSAADIALLQMVEGAAYHGPRVEYGGQIYTPSPIALAASPSSPAAGIGPVTAAVFASGPPYAVTRWMDGLATFPTSACGTPQAPLDPARQLCMAPFADACSSAGGGPVFAPTATSPSLYGIITKVGAGAACAASRAVATYVPAYRDWITRTIEATGPGGAIQLGWELPSAGSGIATGISNVQGWAYSRAGAIASIRLERVNAKGAVNHLLTVPCCSERGDVAAALPDAPVASGFSAAINWANIGRNPSFLVLIVRDTAGNERRELRRVQPVQVLAGTPYPTGLKFTDASTCAVSDSYGRATITCSGVEFAQRACHSPIELRWADEKQSFEVSKGCR